MDRHEHGSQVDRIHDRLAVVLPWPKAQEPERDLTWRWPNRKKSNFARLWAWWRNATKPLLNEDIFAIAETEYSSVSFANVAKRASGKFSIISPLKIGFESRESIGDTSALGNLLRTSGRPPSSSRTVGSGPCAGWLGRAQSEYVPTARSSGQKSDASTSGSVVSPARLWLLVQGTRN